LHVIHGPDANAFFAAIEPLLRSSPLDKAGSTVRLTKKRPKMPDLRAVLAFEVTHDEQQTLAATRTDDVTATKGKAVENVLPTGLPKPTALGCISTL